MKNIRRILSLLLAFALPFAAISVAETIDISGFSYDDLIVLKDKINQAIWETHGRTEFVVPMGSYTVGEDIPSGKYTLTLAKPDDYSLSIVTIYSETGKMVGHYYLMNETDVVGKVTLSTGYTISISSDSVLFSPYKGLGF